MSRSPIRRAKPPRISVNDLALYMVSSETAKIGIIKRSFDPQTFVTTRYKDVRGPVCSYLADPLHHVNPLTDAEQMFVQRSTDPAESSLRQDDAKQSIEVLHSIQAMRNQFGGYQFIPAPVRQGKLVISDVTVSVRADMLVHGVARGIEQIGAAILRMTKDDASTPTAQEKRRQMGLYVATLARMHVDQNISTNRAPANRLCMSIDVQHGEIFAAPASNARRVSDIQNACTFIAAVWGQV